MVYQILITSKTLIPFIRFSNYAFTEKTLALPNMCLVIHVMGKLFNILKELSLRKRISGNLLLQRVHP